MIVGAHAIERTVDDLRTRGVEFSGPVTNQGFGRLISMKLPGGGELGLYEPRHATPTSLPD